MHKKLRNIGNSWGLIIPISILDLLKDENSILVLETSVNVTVDFNCYKVLSEKKYSDTKIIFLKLNI